MGAKLYFTQIMTFKQLFDFKLPYKNHFISSIITNS